MAHVTFDKQGRRTAHFDPDDANDRRALDGIVAAGVRQGLIPAGREHADEGTAADVAAGAQPGVHENWLPVVGYESTYEVSDMGSVRRLLSDGATRLLHPGLNPHGYLRVGLATRGERTKHFRVHTLVARAFLGSCPEGMEIDHRDGDRTNNRRTNLEYVTRSENHLRAHRLGLKKPTRFKGDQGGFRLSDAQVVEIRELQGRETQAAVAQRYGVSHSHIGRIWNGRTRIPAERNGSEPRQTPVADPGDQFGRNGSAHRGQGCQDSAGDGTPSARRSGGRPAARAADRRTARTGGK